MILFSLTLQKLSHLWSFIPFCLTMIKPLELWQKAGGCKQPEQSTIWREGASIWSTGALMGSARLLLWLLVGLNQILRSKNKLAIFSIEFLLKVSYKENSYRTTITTTKQHIILISGNKEIQQQMSVLIGNFFPGSRSPACPPPSRMFLGSFAPYTFSGHPLNY